MEDKLELRELLNGPKSVSSKTYKEGFKNSKLLGRLSLTEVPTTNVKVAELEPNKDLVSVGSTEQASKDLKVNGREINLTRVTSVVEFTEELLKSISLETQNVVLAQLQDNFMDNVAELVLKGKTDGGKVNFESLGEHSTELKSTGDLTPYFNGALTLSNKANLDGAWVLNKDTLVSLVDFTSMTIGDSNLSARKGELTLFGQPVIIGEPEGEAVYSTFDESYTLYVLSGGFTMKTEQTNGDKLRGVVKVVLEGYVGGANTKTGNTIKITK